MSYCVRIRTKHTITVQDLLKHLVDRGERLVVTSEKFPTLRFGTHLKALRGVEVSQEDNGYEVRACSYSSRADYLLFASTTDVLMSMTGGRAYIEDEDEDEVTSPKATFDKEWMKSQYDSGFDCVRLLVGHGHHITMSGLFCDICVGPRILRDFGIPTSGTYDRHDRDILMDHLCAIQWQLASKKDTATHMVMQSPTGDSKQNLTMSMISISDGKVSDFDYISMADVLTIIDLDNRDTDPVIIPFDEIWKILPQDLFSPLDERQFKRMGNVSVSQVHEIMERARSLQPDDLHYSPTYPGEGFDGRQRTFILMWNPAFSSVTLDDHCQSIGNILTEYFNWSVWEHGKARCGDRFFLVRVGRGRTGIVMSGVFDSQPYEGNDWSGRGRQTFYMDMLPNVVLDPEKAPMVSTEDLFSAIPTFDWSGGHSGRLLCEESARLLEDLWHQYLQGIEKQIDGVTINVNRRHTYEHF